MIPSMNNSWNNRTMGNGQNGGGGGGYGGGGNFGLNRRIQGQGPMLQQSRTGGLSGMGGALINRFRQQQQNRQFNRNAGDAGLASLANNVNKTPGAPPPVGPNPAAAAPPVSTGGPAPTAPPPPAAPGAPGVFHGATPPPSAPGAAMPPPADTGGNVVAKGQPMDNGGPAAPPPIMTGGPRPTPPPPASASGPGPMLAPSLQSTPGDSMPPDPYAPGLSGGDQALAPSGPPDGLPPSGGDPYGGSVSPGFNPNGGGGDMGGGGPMSADLDRRQPASDQPQMFARGGFPGAPIMRASSISSPRSSQVLANPVPMARQMMRYRTQGGPMSRLQSPTQSPKYSVDTGKFGSKRFPMPRSEMGSMTSAAYQ